MGEIVGAGFVAHVPTMVLPEADRRALNDGHELSLVTGLHRLRAEVLDVLRPDTIVVLDSHWLTTVEFVVTAHERRSGLYTSDELPRGMAQVPYDIVGDRELAQAFADEAAARDDTWIHASNDPYLPIHYPTVNLLGFLQRDERWISISTCQTAHPDDFLLIGELLARAVARTDRRVVLLASGALSHTFWPLRELRKHEASDPSHIISQVARDADHRVLQHWATGDHRAVIDEMPTFQKVRPEGRFAHYLTMVGALGGRSCIAPGEHFSDYENAIGTAQIHVWFRRPTSGWTAGG